MANKAVSAPIREFKEEVADIRRMWLQARLSFLISEFQLPNSHFNGLGVIKQLAEDIHRSE